jgi:pilus assembly protein CpaF
MSSPPAVIAARVRERVRREKVTLTPELAASFVRDEVRRYSEQALGGAVPLLTDEESVAREAVAELTGLGALQPLLDDPAVEELWINAPDAVFVARNGVTEATGIHLTDSEVRDLVERMLQGSGRRVDLSSPFVDASLPDGSRLHVVIPDVTRRHWAVNVRRFNRRIRDLSSLVELGTLTAQAAEFLRMAVLAGQSVLVSGATQSGKTTLLGALLAASRPTDRIVTVEETFELALPHRDSVSLQCRQPSLEGGGEVTLRRLIKEALRMRPDRLVVGEVREAEALDLLIALNSGLPGASSIHANSARDALTKLATLPLLAGRNIDAAFVVPTVASTIDLVVHCRLERSGRRRVVEIIAPTGRVIEGVPEAVTLFELGAGSPTTLGATTPGDLTTTPGAMAPGSLAATGHHPPRVEGFERVGLDPAIVLGPSRVPHRSYASDSS